MITKYTNDATENATSAASSRLTAPTGPRPRAGAALRRGPPRTDSTSSGSIRARALPASVAGSNSSWRATSSSAAAADRPPICPSARAAAARTNGTRSSSRSISWSRPVLAPSRPIAAAPAARTSEEASRSRGRSTSAASAEPSSPTRSAAWTRKAGSGWSSRSSRWGTAAGPISSSAAPVTDRGTRCATEAPMRGSTAAVAPRRPRLLVAAARTSTLGSSSASSRSGIARSEAMSPRPNAAPTRRRNRRLRSRCRSWSTAPEASKYAPIRSSSSPRRIRE